MSAKRLKLRILTIMAFVVFTSFISIPTGLALVPSDVQLTYEFQSQTLTVNVTHVGQNKNDYIATIEIFKNEVSVLNRTYTNQSADWGVLDTFSVSAVISDNFTVTATCSKGYSITRWLIVTSTTATNSSTTGQTSTTQSTTTTPTTGLTNTTDAQNTPLSIGPAVVAGVAIIIFFILFFFWLKPEYAPETLKKMGARLKGSFIWLGEKLKDLFIWLRDGVSSLAQQIRVKISSK